MSKKTIQTCATKIFICKWFFYILKKTVGPVRYHSTGGHLRMLCISAREQGEVLKVWNTYKIQGDQYGLAMIMY